MKDLLTDNYTTLVKDGKQVAVIKPNIPFGSEVLIEGAVNTAWCTVRRGGEIVFVLKPGQIIPQLKDKPKPELTLSELRELCREAAITFKVKSTKAQLMKLLGL